MVHTLLLKIHQWNHVRYIHLQALTHVKELHQVSVTFLGSPFCDSICFDKNLRTRVFRYIPLFTKVKSEPIVDCTWHFHYQKCRETSNNDLHIYGVINDQKFWYFREVSGNSISTSFCA